MKLSRNSDKNYKGKTKRSDFRFGVTESGFTGTFIFSDGDNSTTIVKDGRIIGEANFTLKTDFSEFFLYVRKNYKYSGQNAYQSLKFFETDIYTGFDDSFKSKIFTGDYIQSVYTSEIHEVVTQDEKPHFYLRNLKYRNGPNQQISDSFVLTRGASYVIIGNRIEGLFKSKLESIQGDKSSV